MGKIARLALIPVLFAAACADDEFQPPPSIDAAAVDAAINADAPDLDAPAIDAIDATPVDAPTDAASSVVTVQCPGNPDLEISAATGAYVPMTATIAVNAIVRFTPGSSGHDMVSGTAPNGNGLFDTVAGDTTCLRFTAAGTFPFFCQIHGFSGTITVQ